MYDLDKAKGINLNMKVLIVEDSKIKRDNIIRLLEMNGINNYVTETFVCNVLAKIQNMKIDLIITDLGLPRFIDNPIVENPKEGLYMLYDLSYDEINIPTIIYSETELYDGQIQELQDIKYPYLGQAKNQKELEEILQKYLLNKKYYTKKQLQKVK